MKINRFEDLEIWKMSTQIAIDVFNLCKEKPLNSDFGTKDQIQRAAFSISNNISEGFEYDNNADFIKFLRYAKGSAGELRSQLYVLNQAGLIPNDFYNNKYNELITLSVKIKNLITYLTEKKKMNKL